MVGHTIRAALGWRPSFGLLAAALSALLLFGLLAGPGEVAPEATGPQSRPDRTHVFADEPVRPRAVRMSAPARAQAGKPLRITGTAKIRRAGETRVVRLMAKFPGRKWRTVAAKKTDGHGDFVFVISPGKVGTKRVYRVRAPREDGLGRAKSNKQMVRVVGGRGAPNSGGGAPGSSSDWSWLFKDESARWNPCKVIRWNYNANGSYSGSLNDMKRAFSLVANKTGLKFSYSGTTTAVPLTDREGAEADITVAWSTARQVPKLAGTVVGVGGASGYGVDGEDVDYRLSNGYVVLDREGTLRRGYAGSGSGTWGQVMVHEVLHALGLGHARGQAQIMFGSVNSNNHNFGAGDLGGMRRIGSAKGCVDD